MDYLSAVTELNYMTQIVIMLYEDNNKVQNAPTQTFVTSREKQTGVKIAVFVNIVSVCQ